MGASTGNAADIQLSIEKDRRKIHFYLMKKALLVVRAALTIKGCTAAKNIAEDYKYTSSLRYFVSDEDKQAYYEEICSEIGLTSEHENWLSCLMRAREMVDAWANSRTAASKNNTRTATQLPQHCAMTNSYF